MAFACATKNSENNLIGYFYRHAELNPCFIRVQSVAKKTIAPNASNARRPCQTPSRRRPSPGRVAASRQSAAFFLLNFFSDGGFLPKAATAKTPTQITLAIPVHTKQLEAMSKVAQIEAELETLSQAELSEIRSWLDDMIEDDLEFSPEFESAIQKSEREMAGGIRPRIRQP